jgi:hypothetical protein
MSALPPTAEIAEPIRMSAKFVSRFRASTSDSRLRSTEAMLIPDLSAKHEKFSKRRGEKR